MGQKYNVNLTFSIITWVWKAPLNATYQILAGHLLWIYTSERRQMVSSMDINTNIDRNRLPCTYPSHALHKRKQPPALSRTFLHKLSRSTGIQGSYKPRCSIRLPMISFPTFLTFWSFLHYFLKWISNLPLYYLENNVSRYFQAISSMEKVGVVLIIF